jgi:hypothetical protein
LVLHDQAADIEVVRPDSAICRAVIAVRDLPGAWSVFPRGTFLRVKDGVFSVFGDVFW